MLLVVLQIWRKTTGAYTESFSISPELIYIYYINHAILIAT